MRLQFFALLVSGVVSQNIPRMPSGCDRKSCVSLFPRGAVAFDSTKGGNIKRRETRDSIGGPTPTSSRVYSLPGPYSAEVSPEHYRFSRRSVGTLFGAAALGLALDRDAAAEESDIKMVTFDRAKGTTQQWIEVDDRQYRGSSRGTTTVNDGILTVDGTVSKESGGFIVGRTGGETGESKKFPDVSSCEGLSFIARSTSPYSGYRISLNNKADNGYKATFEAPLNKFGTVRIPFKDFTDSYDMITGLPRETCRQNKLNCIDFNPGTLKGLGGITFWAEAPGKVHLEVKEISAYGCTSAPAPAPSPAPELAAFDKGSGTSVFWYFSSAALVLVVFFLARIQTQPRVVAPLLLG